MFIRVSVMCLAFLIGGVVPALAQSETEAAAQRLAENADFFDIDLFVPSGPALVALGDSARNAADPGAPKDFAFEFGTVTDGDKSRFGAALTTLPYWWGHRDTTLDGYRTETGRLERIGARTQASLGLAQAGGESIEALRLSVAVQAQLLDRQDAKFDQESVRCIHQAWDDFRRPAALRVAQKIAEAIASGQDLTDDDLLRIQEDGLRADSDDAFLTAREVCRDRAAGRLLAQRSVTVGAGLGLRSEETDGLEEFDYDGHALWASFRQPIDSKGRLALFGFLRRDVDRVFDLDGDQRAQGHAIVFGLGGAYQTPRFRFDLAAAFNARDFLHGVRDDEFMTYTAVLDIRLREGLWLELAGGTVDGSDYIDGGFGSVSVKIAWGDVFPFF